jgi:hypothetical protein
MVGEPPNMRTLWLSLLFVAAVLIAVHQASSHAHAHEPPVCGFWDSIEAGLSCR